MRKTWCQMTGECMNRKSFIEFARKIASQGPQYFPLLFQLVTKTNLNTESASRLRGLPLHVPRTAVLLLSSPSNLANQLNRHKTREIKLPAEWHSSFPPTRIIKAVEMRERSPARASGFFYLPLRRRNRRLFHRIVYENAHLALFFLQKSGFRGAYLGNMTRQTALSHL